MSLVDAAYHFHDLAAAAAVAGQRDAVRGFIEQAYTAGLMDGAGCPVLFQIRPRAELPQLANAEHAIVRISRDGVAFEARDDLLDGPCLAYERLAVLGALFAPIVASFGSSTKLLGGIIDLGDGTDAGDYVRVAHSSGMPQTVLVPDPFFYISRNYESLRAHVAQAARPWAERKDILFWRGTATGIRLRTLGPDDALYVDWTWLPRLALCAATRRSFYAERIDVALTDTGPITEPYLKEAIGVAGFLKPQVPKESFADYRYLIDIDGYTNAWSLLEKMIMGATIFKVASPSGFRQWYYEKLEPWEAYVPVSADLSDLDEKVAWAFDHPEACQRIAANAAEIAAQIDFTASMAAAVEAISGALQSPSKLLMG